MMGTVMLETDRFTRKDELLAIYHGFNRLCTRLPPPPPDWRNRYERMVARHLHQQSRASRAQELHFSSPSSPFPSSAATTTGAGATREAGEAGKAGAVTKTPQNPCNNPPAGITAIAASTASQAADLPQADAAQWWSTLRNWVTDGSGGGGGGGSSSAGSRATPISRG